MGEIAAFPGIDERNWAKLAPMVRAGAHMAGLGDAAADAIEADVKMRVLRCGALAAKVPADAERDVVRCVVALIAEIAMISMDLYVARNYPDAL